MVRLKYAMVLSDPCLMPGHLVPAILFFIIDFGMQGATRPIDNCIETFPLCMAVLNRMIIAFRGPRPDGTDHLQPFRGNFPRLDPLVVHL